MISHFEFYGLNCLERQHLTADRVLSNDDGGGFIGVFHVYFASRRVPNRLRLLHVLKIVEVPSESNISTLMSSITSARVLRPTFTNIGCMYNHAQPLFSSTDNRMRRGNT